MKVCVFVTSYRKGPIVFSVNDETVHMQGDRRRLRVGGIVTGTVILQERQYMCVEVQYVLMHVCVCV